MQALPGWAIDLITEGIRGADLTRAEVVRAVRQVMLSARRAGWAYTDVHSLLTDTKDRRLAAQISTGHGSRPIPQRQVNALLLKHWDDTAKVVAARPAWSRDDALGFVETVRDQLDGGDLPDLHRNVMAVVIDLAAQHGTTRPAVPVRVVVVALGLDPERSAHRMRVSRALKALASKGEWLALAKAGNPRTRRANLYALAPPLAVTYGGASPPMSQGPPMSHPPMSHEGAEMNEGSLTLRLDPDEQAAVLRLLADLRAQPRPDADVRPLRAVGGAEDGGGR